MTQHVEDAEIDMSVINTAKKLSVTPPWLLEPVRVNFDLARHRKDNTSCVVYKQAFLEMCTHYPNQRKIFTDGSKTDQGVGAAALLSSSTEPKSLTLRLPVDSSIYSAELQALILSLKLVYQSQENSFLILSDSLSALQAIITLHTLNHPLLFEFHELHTSLMQDNREIFFAWVPSHVGIRGNEAVDRIAKEAIEEEVSRTRIPHSDLKRNVNKYIKDVWQLHWSMQTANKLWQIRPDLDDTLQSGNRREESVLCRLHIGHSFLTHSFLLRREDRPECIPCGEPLTIKHILIDCVDFYDVRMKYFSVSSLKILFRDVPPDIIFKFLREIRIFRLF